MSQFNPNPIYNPYAQYTNPIPKQLCPLNTCSLVQKESHFKPGEVYYFCEKCHIAGKKAKENNPQHFPNSMPDVVFNPETVNKNNNSSPLSTISNHLEKISKSMEQLLKFMESQKLNQ